MGMVLYQEPYFIWKDETIYNGLKEKETAFVIGDLSWLKNDYGYMSAYQNIYADTLKLLKEYKRNDSDTNFFRDIIGMIFILDAIKTNPDVRVLYIGDDETRLIFFCKIIKLFANARVPNRCFLQNISDNVLKTFYGNGTGMIQKAIETLGDLEREFFDIVIIDADLNTDLQRDAIPYADNKNGRILVFNDTRALYARENVKLSPGGGGEPVYRAWYSFFKRDLKADNTLTDIRKNKAAAFIAMLKNLYSEVPYLRMNTFEDLCFIDNAIKILNNDLNEIYYTFSNNQAELRNGLENILKGLTALRANPQTKDALIPLISNILEILSRSSVNDDFCASPYEREIKYIVQNNIPTKEMYQCKDAKEKLNFYNFADFHSNIQDNWLYQFIVKNIPDRKKELNIFQPFGDNIKIRFMKVPNKIFQCGEDSVKRYIETRDGYIEGVDLSIYITGAMENEKAVYLPPCAPNIFYPVLDINLIREQIEKINAARSQCIKECAMICSHDTFMSRTAMAKDLSEVLDMKFPGYFNHNDDSLRLEFDNNKAKYLNQFMFCACPENVNVKNYTTEKVLDAFKSGCIPIYYGSHDKLFPEYLNNDAALFWQNGGDNTELKKTILRLKSDPEFYRKFIGQVKIKKGFDEYMYDRFLTLKRKIEELCM